MPALEAAIVLLVFWGTLAFGGVYPWGYWSIAIGAVAIGLGSIVVTRRSNERYGWAIAWCLLAVIVAVAVQIVPLPLATFERLNPAGTAVLSTSDLGYLVRPPTQHTLALVPERAEVTMAIVAALGVLLIGLVRAVPQFKLERVVLLLTFVGVLLAVFAVAQRAVNIKSNDNDAWQLVYGFWKPKQAGNVFGPFINRNHFAGWMIMALPLAIGYACAVAQMTAPSSRHGWQRRVAWMTTPAASRFMTMSVAVLAMGTALVASGSRSGIAGFAVALVVLSAFTAKRLGGGKARAIALGYLAALLVGGLAWVGIGATVQRFSLASTDVGSRIGAWRDTMRIIHDFPLFGTGIGSFGKAMLVYQTGDRQVFYAHAHNDYLQVAAEGGLLVGIPVAVCLIGLARGIRRRVVAGEDGLRAYWIRSGAIAALAGIGAQSLVEFSLQIPANSVLFVLVAAIALHRPIKTTEHARRI